MKKEYTKWIKSNYPTSKESYGMCHVACKKMKKEFPELKMVRGWYYEPIWDEDREHWWLKATNGRIVDPTAQQFPTKGTSYYKEFIEGFDKEPTGKCMNCGEYCYDGRTHSCSKKCDLALKNYYNSI